MNIVKYIYTKNKPYTTTNNGGFSIPNGWYGFELRNKNLYPIVTILVPIANYNYLISYLNGEAP